MAKGHYLGEFEQLVLLALAQLGKNAYGVAVRREIAERTGRSVAIGSVYATLERLERKGLVATQTADPTPVRGGRAKRFFTLRAAGRDALARSRRMLERMSEGIALGAGRSR